MMVRSLHPKTDEFDVFEYFSAAGKVNDVRLIVDEKGRCQGVGYVEMADAVSMAKALMLNGSMLRGQSIIVQASLAEKNRLAAAGASASEIKQIAGTMQQAQALGAQQAQQAVAAVGAEPTSMKLYVGGLHF